MTETQNSGKSRIGKYQVFSLEADGRWEQLKGPFEASSRRDAIRKATQALSQEEQTGTFFALGESEFKPLARTLRPTMVDEFADA